MSPISPVLSVKDVDTTLVFYTEKLGFQPGSTLPGPDGKATFGNAYYGDAMIMFNSWYPATEQNTARGVGVELQLDVLAGEDIDVIYAEVCAKGLTITQEIKDEFWGDRTFCLQDPDGYNLRFIQTPSIVTLKEMAEVAKRGA
jgi:PhnB protein